MWAALRHGSSTHALDRRCAFMETHRDTNTRARSPTHDLRPRSAGRQPRTATPAVLRGFLVHAHAHTRAHSSHSALSAAEGAGLVGNSAVIPHVWPSLPLCGGVWAGLLLCAEPTLGSRAGPREAGARAAPQSPQHSQATVPGAVLRPCRSRLRVPGAGPGGLQASALCEERLSPSRLSSCTRNQPLLCGDPLPKPPFYPPTPHPGPKQWAPLFPLLSLWGAPELPDLLNQVRFLPPPEGGTPRQKGSWVSAAPRASWGPAPSTVWVLVGP